MTDEKEDTVALLKGKGWGQEEQGINALLFARYENEFREPKNIPADNMVHACRLARRVGVDKVHIEFKGVRDGAWSVSLDEFEAMLDALLDPCNIEPTTGYCLHHRRHSPCTHDEARNAFLPGPF